jgi:hypothetical protein
MFFSGFYPSQNHIIYHAEIEYLKQLIQKYPDYHFLLKEHPSYSSFDKGTFVKEIFSDKIDIINPRIPYEIFIIADIIPEKVAGRLSSLCYTLSNEQIESYIVHSSYVNGLKKYINLDTKKQIKVDSYIPKEPYFFDITISKNGKIDHIIQLSTKNGYLFNERQIKELSQNKSFLLLKNKDETYELFIRKNENEPYQQYVHSFYNLHHKYWQDILILKSDKTYCRVSNNDCGTIDVTEQELNICWEQWGCETFKKQKNSIVYKLKDNRR